MRAVKRHTHDPASTGSIDRYLVDLPPAVDLTPEEGRALFDQLARELMNMSGDESLRQWDAGEFADPDRPEIVRLVVMMPLYGRPVVMP